MKVIIDKSMEGLGITDIVYAIGRKLDPGAALTVDLEEEIRTMGRDVVAGRYDEVIDNEVTEGYRELIRKVGRSLKKNVPTVPALIENIKNRGEMPRVNSIVDIYNLESLRSSIATGGHDLARIHGDVVVTVSGREDTFTAIGGSEKHVEPTDFIYRDDKGILAYLDVRDSEFYKMSDATDSIFFVMQGNEKTSVEYRIKAMKRIEANLREINPDMEFEIGVASI